MCLNKLNNYLTYIPVFLIWEYLFLFLIRNTNWYKDNFYWIDGIDNFIVLVLIIHFLCFVELYNKKKIFYISSIFLNLMLQYMYYFIPENIYYFIYLLLISLPITLHII